MANPVTRNIIPLLPSAVTAPPAVPFCHAQLVLNPESRAILAPCGAGYGLAVYGISTYGDICGPRVVLTPNTPARGALTPRAETRGALVAAPRTRATLTQKVCQ